ncbi:MAG: hypothetical protein WC091_23230, partial [Sulfuricellaceae bacterium]
MRVFLCVLRGEKGFILKYSVEPQGRRGAEKKQRVIVSCDTTHLVKRKIVVTYLFLCVSAPLRLS